MIRIRVVNNRKRKEKILCVESYLSSIFRSKLLNCDSKRFV